MRRNRASTSIGAAVAIAATLAVAASLTATQAPASSRTSTASEPLVLRGHRGVVSSVGAAGDRIVSGGVDGTVRVWRAASGRELSTLRPGAEVHAVALSPDARAIAAGAGKRVVLWAEGATRPRWTRDLPGYASALAFAPDGQTLAVTSTDGTLSLLSTRDGEPRATKSLRDEGGSVAYSRDGRSLAAGGRAVQVWRDTSPAPLTEPRKLSGHRDLVFALSFSPDGARLVSASLDQTAKLWNVDDGTVVATLTTSHPARLLIGGRERAVPQQLPVTAAAWSPDGTVVATAGGDRAVHMWDAQTGKLRSSREGHTRAVTSLAFTADGRVVSASSDGTVRVW